MAPSSLTARTIINELLGGRRNVALITGARPNAVAQWYRIGIPAKFWPVIKAAADERGIPDITFDALAATKVCPGDAVQPEVEARGVFA